MSLLVACVLILAVLTVLNMSLSAAIIRTLRASRGEPPPLPQPGDTVTPFSASMLDGGEVDERVLDDVLAVFVAPTCGPCSALLETWQERSADLPDNTIGFVISTSTDEEAQAYAGKLGPRVRSGVVGRDSEVARAFGVADVTPTLVRVRSGIVEQAGHTLDSVLPDRAQVTR